MGGSLQLVYLGGVERPLDPGSGSDCGGQRRGVDQLAGLLPRGCEPCQLIRLGGQRGVSEATVKTHLAHAFDKLGVGDRAAAVRVAYERGLL